MRFPFRPGLFALALTAGLAGAATAQPPYPPVPEPRIEQVPPPPGERFVWEPGHWHWDGAAYVWIGGHYVLRHRHWGAYEPGRWVLRDGDWVWVPAHWR
jgi:hypothetical protein